MNIQQYYRQSAAAALNASLISICIPVIITIVCFLLTIQEMIIFTLPFLLYSFICYQSYHLNEKRYIETKQAILQKHSKTFSQSDQFLLTFLPSASLHLQFYHPTGELAGELVDLNQRKVRWFLPYFLDRLIPAKYGLYENQELIATFHMKNQVEIYDLNDKQHITVIRKNGKTLKIIGEDKVNFLKVNSHSLFLDMQFMNKNDEEIARVRKGWLPIEWTDVFKDSNTPLLTFDSSCKMDKLAILGIIASEFRYHNH